MTKVGLITAVVAFILSIGITLISPVCLICFAVIVGLVAGYLACNTDRPPAHNAVAGPGALAGLFAGLGMLVGQIIGSVINSMIVGPEGASNLLRQLGLPTQSINQTSYYGGVIFGVCCIGLLNVGLTAGLGALGGLLWWEIAGKNQPPPADQLLS